VRRSAVRVLNPLGQSVEFGGRVAECARSIAPDIGNDLVIDVGDYALQIFFHVGGGVADPILEGPFRSGIRVGSGHGMPPALGCGDNCRDSYQLSV